MDRRILITGAGGFLGSRCFNYYEKKTGWEAVGVTHQELDISDSLAVSAFVRAARPDVVLHCAAVSDTGRCEREPELSEVVNVRGTSNVARACRETGSRLIFMSSDQVYSAADSLEPNREGRERRPAGVYGRQKKRAEETVLSMLKDGIALRLTWMYDFPHGEGPRGNGLLQRLIEAARAGEQLILPVHEYRGITYVQEVLENLERVMELPGGIYNFGSANACSTFEVAERFGSGMGEALGLRPKLARDEQRFAACPRNLTINTEKAESYGIHFCSTMDGFWRCLNDRQTYSWAF